MTYKAFLVGCMGLIMVGLGLMPVAAADLPTSNWYAVLHTQQSDQLVWINAQGVQATINRPQMPNESQDEGGTRDVRISPDGRYGVFTATLNDNRIGLGFYDFQAGAWLQLHTSQPNETINLGHWNSFLSDMAGVAIAFYTLGNNGVTDWRIIEFDPKTGTVLNLLQKSDNAFTEPAVGAGAFPSVFYAQDGLGYRFHMIPYAVGGSVNYDAFTWAPAADTVTADGMITTELDILPTTNYIIESGYEVALPSVSLDGPIPILNVLTQRNSFETAPMSLLHDENASLFSPRWVRNGEWYAYSAYTNDMNYWVVHSTVGSDVYMYSDLTPREIYGTSEGMLLDYDGASFVASTEMDASNQPVIYEAPPNDQAEVVYVTPQGSFFTLPSVADGQLGEPPQQPSATASVTCNNSPQSQVTIGMPVRVTFTDGSSLNVRQEPNGTIITELAEGTEFTLIDGPVCADDLRWWKMSMPIQGGTLEGWVAEGVGATYFIEPWSEDDGGNEPLPVITPLVAVTVKPPVLQITPMVITTLQLAPTATPTKMVLINPPVLSTKPILVNPNFIVDNDCSFAVAAYFSVGDTVATIGSGLAVYSSPTAATPDANLDANVSGSVTGGPSCHKGFRKWNVSFSNGVTGWVADSYGGNVYLKKQ